MDGPSKYPYFSTSIAALATISLPNKSSKALRTLQDSASVGKNLIPTNSSRFSQHFKILQE
jgi:hypothetical protein